MKCLRILLATFITVLSIGLFAPSSANASFGNSYIVTDSVKLQIPSGNGAGVFSDTEYDITNHIGELVYGIVPTIFPDNTNEDIRYHINQSGFSTLTPAEVAFMRDSWNSKTSWTISQGPLDNASRTVLVNWTDSNKELPLTFHEDRVTTDQYLDGYTLEIRLGQGSHSSLRSKIIVRVYQPEQNRDIRPVATPRGDIISHNRNPSAIPDSQEDIMNTRNLLSFNVTYTYPEDYTGIPIKEDSTPQPKTPVWLNYAVKILNGEKMTIQSENWTNYRDKHGGGIRYGDVGGTSDITLCRIEDKDNTGCVDTLAFVENKSGPISLEYPKTMIGQTGYYKVFIDNTNKEPNIPPFDSEDYPFDVKNRSIIVFNDGTSTVAIDTIGYYEDEPYFPQYDDNVYYNKFMNHDLIDDHGLLNVVLAPIGYLSELPKVTCKPLNLPMPSRFGEDINLPCMTESVYQPQFPQIFQIYQLLITAIFSYMVGLRIFQNIKEMSSEKDDSIEVVKL